MEKIEDNALVRFTQETSELSRVEHKNEEQTVESASVTNNNSGLDDNGNQNKEEDLNLGDTSSFTTEERTRLFQRGLEYEKNNESTAALQCYLGCVQGLKNRRLFVFLPQCLYNIANIYREQGNSECAFHFSQAEKLFSETSVIETEEIQGKLEEMAADTKANMNELNSQAQKAEKFEQLAKLYVDKKQQHLALEYAEKCTKLRQQVYGKDHEKTKVSLQFWAALYAQVGRLHCSDTINILNQSFQDDADIDNENEALSKTPEVIMSNPAGGEPVSILRQRSEDGSKETDREKKKQVRFHESVEESLRLKEKEELVSLTMTLMLLAVCITISASMGMWLYCAVEKNQSCQAIMAQFQHWLRSIQYYYHALTAPTSSPPSSLVPP